MVRARSSNTALMHNDPFMMRKSSLSATQYLLHKKTYKTLATIRISFIYNLNLSNLAEDFSFTEILLNSTLQSILHCLRETFSRSRAAFLCSVVGHGRETPGWQPWTGSDRRRVRKFSNVSNSHSFNSQGFFILHFIFRNSIF